MEGIIVALHTGGDTENIGKCRGIILGNHVGKLFCLIFKDRLSKVVVLARNYWGGTGQV